MRRLNPSAADLVDQMIADHRAIAPHIETVSAAAAAWQARETSRDALARALDDLHVPLDPHLRREVDEMMPICAATLTARQWADWESEYYLKPKSKSELALEGSWLIDGADRAAYDVVVGKVNPVLRFVLLNVFGRRYRRECAVRWGPEVPVGPRPT